MLWWAIFAAGVWLAERLPQSLVTSLAAPAGVLLASLPTSARARLKANLAHAAGLPPSSPRVMRLARRAYVTQVSNYLDLMRCRRIDPEKVAARFTMVGPGWDEFLAAARSGKGCVLVSPHYGRLELLNHFLVQFRFKLTLAVERLSHPRLFELVCSLRSRHGWNLAPHDAGIRPWLRALSRGEVVALFAEWDPSGRGVPVRLFGAEAVFPPGPAFLAVRAGVPLFAGHEMPGLQPGTHRCYMSRPLTWERCADQEEEVRRATQAIASAFEERIAEDPSRWVMFHDIWSAPVSQSQQRTGPEQPTTNEDRPRLAV